jgi:soluble lytic murein transglycosylase-like protein
VIREKSFAESFDSVSPFFYYKGHMGTLGKAFEAFAAFVLVFICAICFSGSATAAELAILRNGFSIRHEHRLVMGTTTRLFLTADDSSFTDVPTVEITGFEKDLLLPVPSSSAPSGADAQGSAQSSLATTHPQVRSAAEMNQVVNSASAAYHLDPDLVNSVIHAESGFNAHAVSAKGARGLMQLMPGTANQLGVNDAFDPQSNVTGGSRYLRELLERYNFDLVKALAAYNAGPHRVEQYRGVPPFRETRAYVARIVHEYNTKKIAQEKEAKRQLIVNEAASAVPDGVRSQAQNKVPSKSARQRRHAKPGTTVIAAQSPQAVAR